MIPKGWEPAKLSDVGIYVNGKAFKPSDWSNKGKPIIRIQNLTGSSNILNRYLGNAEEKYQISDGDFLISWSATLGAFIYHGEDAVLNQHIFKVIPFIDKKFLFYLVKSIINDLKQKVHGSGMQHITKGKFDNHEILVPPLKEQKRIVSKLDILIAKNQNIRQEILDVEPIIEKLKKSILKKAFSGKLVQRNPKDEPIVINRNQSKRRSTGKAATNVIKPGKAILSIGLPDLPTPPGWKWISLLEVSELASGHTPTRKKLEYWDGNIPWVTGGDAGRNNGKVIYDTKEHISKLGLENSPAVLLPEETVCLAREANIGDVVILGKPMATNQRFVNFICGKNLIPEFLFYAFMFERTSLFKFGQGAIHQTIYFPEVKAFHICLPPPKEQIRIVKKIKELFIECDNGLISINLAKNVIEDFEPSIYKKAFRGKLVKQNSNDQPASELLESIKNLKQ